MADTWKQETISSPWSQVLSIQPTSSPQGLFAAFQTSRKLIVLTQYSRLHPRASGKHGRLQRNDVCMESLLVYSILIRF